MMTIMTEMTENISPMQQTTKQVSRGLRNNNPLNIRRGGDRWQGSTRVQKDPDFVTFKELKWGYRAAWKVLATYSRRFAKERKPFNLFHILSQWAPETDGNNVRAYVHAVMKLGGIGGREHFPQPDCVSGYRRLPALLMAMTCVECGVKPSEVDMQAIRDGFRLAFPHIDLSDEDRDVDEEHEYVLLEDL